MFNKDLLYFLHISGEKSKEIKRDLVWGDTCIMVEAVRISGFSRM